MSNMHVVSRERHANKRWQRYTSYEHTAGDAVAYLVVPELPKACVAMPTGFVELKGVMVPVAIQGTEPGRNLFVAHDGRWLAGYVPAVYRSYPFARGATQDGQHILCIDEDSDLLSDTHGEVFFDEHGELAPLLKKTLAFMVQVADQRKATQRISAVLQKHRLIQPWPFKRQTSAGEQAIEGLYRIDKEAFSRLSAQALHEVRMTGALPVVYCHFVSMQHLPALVQRAQLHTLDDAALPLAPAGDLDLEFLNNDGTISFGVADLSVS